VKRIQDYIILFDPFVIIVIDEHLEVIMAKTTPQINDYNGRLGTVLG
jgi:hypothetical protein